MFCCKENERWQDALRVAKEYLPNRLEALQDEYDNHVAKHQGVNAAGLMSQGRNWELQGEFSRAVDCYFKVILYSSTKQSHSILIDTIV